jgi:hypothetical protein
MRSLPCQRVVEEYDSHTAPNSVNERRSGEGELLAVYLGTDRVTTLGRAQMRSLFQPTLESLMDEFMTTMQAKSSCDAHPPPVRRTEPLRRPA